MNIVKLASHRQAATRYFFANGNEVSVIFGIGTYSDNNSLWEEKGFEYEGLLTSRTVEIMVDGHPTFIKWFEKKYEYNPAGYLSLDEMQKILRRADSKVYAAKKKKEHTSKEANK